jgi:hypothetical protein
MQQLRNLCRPITAGIVASAALYADKQIEKENLKKKLKGYHEDEINAIEDYINIAQSNLTNDGLSIQNLKNDLLSLRHRDPVQKQLQDLAHKHHNLENIAFHKTIAGYHSLSITNTIFIPTEDYNALRTQIAENPNQDVTTHPDNAHIMAILHHECGHLIHKSSETTQKIESLYPAIMGVFVERKLGKKPHKELLKPRSLLVVSACYMLSYGINLGLTHAFRKYDETRADDTIPNDPLLLRAALEDRKAYDEDTNKAIEQWTQNAIENAKKNVSENEWKKIEEMLSKKAGMTPSELYLWMFKKRETLRQFFMDVHPSDEFRANRFKARLDALENSNATLKKKSDEK